MSAIEVVAKPVLSKAESEWLIQVRERQAHNVGPPEFTLVFPGTTSPTREVTEHVKAVCAATSRIHFCLRSAVIVPDDSHSSFLVFLVPDAGFGAIVRLHDRLHVGPLAACLRPEVPYIPHITIAAVKEFVLARRIKASLNSNDFAIAGHLDELEVHERDAGAPRCVAKVPLVHHGIFH